MSKHVFIIEDNQLLVKMYQSIFQTLGCSVTHASSIGDALRLLQGMKVDLFILDDRLAGGSSMDAAQALRLQCEAADTPIIATVSRLSTRDDEAVCNAGFASIVTKPFQISAFSALAQRYVGRASPTAAA